MKTLRRKDQVDYITINRRFRNTVKYCKTYPSANNGSGNLLFR